MTAPTAAVGGGVGEGVGATGATTGTAGSGTTVTCKHSVNWVVNLRKSIAALQLSLDRQPPWRQRRSHVFLQAAPGMCSASVRQGVVEGHLWRWHCCFHRRWRRRWWRRRRQFRTHYNCLHPHVHNSTWADNRQKSCRRGDVTNLGAPWGLAPALVQELVAASAAASQGRER